MVKKIISKSPQDTEKIAKEFFESLKIQNFKGLSTVIALSGELGAGKTTFTQALGKHLGIKKKINSPTFVIMKKYLLTKSTRKNFLADKTKSVPAGENFHEHFFSYLFHLDAYRLKNEKELEKLGWAEIIADPKNLILIEWPENVKKSIPKKHISIKIAHIKDGERKFEIKHP
ncbi:MAG: tRNA (adenosine(37)-N6)-threonylcarbamoyltransferase complex ATPase subunit type 1 TsaE [Patescibacteria group bacterium]